MASGGPAKAQAAGPQVTGKVVMSERFQLGTFAAVLNVVSRPVITACWLSANGPAAGTMQDQVRRCRVTGGVDDEPFRIGGEPVQVAFVVIDEVPHSVTMPASQGNVMHAVGCTGTDRGASDGSTRIERQSDDDE